MTLTRAGSRSVNEGSARPHREPAASPRRHRLMVTARAAATAAIIAGRGRGGPPVPDRQLQDPGDAAVDRIQVPQGPHPPAHGMTIVGTVCRPLARHAARAADRRGRLPSSLPSATYARRGSRSGPTVLRGIPPAQGARLIQGMRTATIWRPGAKTAHTPSSAVCDESRSPSGRRPGIPATADPANPVTTV